MGVSSKDKAGPCYSGELVPPSVLWTLIQPIEQDYVAVAGEKNNSIDRG